MTEYEKTPTISHQTTSPSGELNLSSPPYTTDEPRGQAQDMNTNCAHDETTPQLTTNANETHLDLQEDTHTPKSGVPKKLVDGAGANAVEAGMPPVQEYAVLTYHNSTAPTSSGLPPRNKLRSPRPRSVKAVDWCPPSSYRSNSTAYTNTGGSGVGSTPTVVTSRAVRGDDATITTYATMTTMGDAASILEGSEDDSSSSSSSSDDESVEVGARDGINGRYIDPMLNASVASGISDSILRADDRSVMSGLGSIYEHPYMHEEDLTTMPQVDKLPSMTSTPGTSVISGTTSKALVDDRSLYSLSTANNANVYYEKTNMGTVQVDKLPNTMGTGGISVISGTTSKALRDPDDRSLYSLNTTNTAGGNIFDVKNTMVDRTPSNVASMVSGNTQHSIIGDEDSDATFSTMNTTGKERIYSHPFNIQDANYVVDHVPEEKEEEDEAPSISARTDGAVRNKEDQSVATWNTFTTGALNDTSVVDVLPTSKHSVVSGTTNQAINDEQSVATWNTMTTAGIGQHILDRVPSLANLAEASISGTTNRAVRAPDDQSVVTFATQTTFGGDRGNRVVDHIPSISEMAQTSNRSEASENNTDYAIGGSQSVATWTTMNTMGNNQLVGDVVDHIPSFILENDTPSSAMSLPTNYAVQEDRSVITFATSATSGERGIQHMVDGIPTFAGGGGRSVVSGITNQAVRMNDDRSITSLNTMTTSGDMGNVYERGNEDAIDESCREQLLFEATTSNPDGSGGEEEEIGTTISSSLRPVPSGILREGRHNRQSNVATQSGFNAGESVSNTHILRAITELRLHVDYRIEELGQANRRDLERVTQIIQQEQTKRTALESRLHSQLLMQSETMVAMELKLLRLEAKMAHREIHRQRRQPATMPVTDRLPPIAATSSPNRSDEEADSFEELDLTPRANRLGSSSLSQGGTNRSPANIAVVTRSGASVASAVTATSFADGDFTNLHDEEERSEESGSDEGDVQDMDQNDGSVSTPHSGSNNNRISNLESILLNPLTSTGSNEQGVSTRAVRGERDEMSSLPTAYTSTTMASTAVTATTRGESIGITKISSRASDEDIGNVQETNDGGARAVAAGRQRSNDRSIHRLHSGDMIDIDGTQQARSRSQSPLTVQSVATETIGTQSVASVSVVPSILSTAAVASSRSFGTRRANAAMAALERNTEGRPLANRVVSFTTNDMEEQSAPPAENDGGGDSITMPDELDTFSDVADAFSNSARAWREEYEARLANLEKRLGN